MSIVRIATIITCVALPTSLPYPVLIPAGDRNPDSHPALSASLSISFLVRMKARLADLHPGSSVVDRSSMQKHHKQC
jgi:hypothetical protein